MARKMVVAAAQLGPIRRKELRSQVVDRMIVLIEQAHAHGGSFVVFPEMALTTFFPRWLIDDEDEIAGFFERDLPGPDTQPLFDAAAGLGVGFYLGFCEEVVEGRTRRRYNSSVLVDGLGSMIGKYRKVHLPGNATYDPSLRLQHLEPWYFEPGNLGFPVFEMLDARLGMLICNDRRWPEPYRVLGLQGVELVCVGFNSPAELPDHPLQNGLRTLHHLAPMQAGAYQNGTWIIASAKAGPEEGFDMMGHSCIVSPSGEVVATSSTLGDELVPYEIDLDLTREYKSFFDFATYRRPECYGLITERKEAGPPIGS